MVTKQAIAQIIHDYHTNPKEGKNRNELVDKLWAAIGGKTTVTHEEWPYSTYTNHYPATCPQCNRGNTSLDPFQCVFCGKQHNPDNWCEEG